MTPEQAVERQLEVLGVSPDDIRYVVLSCLVPDHAGGMRAFPNATFIVQFRELQDAWWPDRRFVAIRAVARGAHFKTRIDGQPGCRRSTMF